MRLYVVKFVKGFVDVENIRAKVANIDVGGLCALRGMDRKVLQARRGQIALNTTVLRRRMRSRVVVQQQFLTETQLNTGRLSIRS